MAVLAASSARLLSSARASLAAISPLMLWISLWSRASPSPTTPGSTTPFCPSFTPCPSLPTLLTGGGGGGGSGGGGGGGIFFWSCVFPSANCASISFWPFAASSSLCSRALHRASVAATFSSFSLFAASADVSARFSFASSASFSLLTVSADGPDGAPLFSFSSSAFFSLVAVAARLSALFSRSLRASFSPSYCSFSCSLRIRISVSRIKSSVAGGGGGGGDPCGGRDMVGPMVGSLPTPWERGDAVRDRDALRLACGVCAGPGPAASLLKPTKPGISPVPGLCDRCSVRPAPGRRWSQVDPTFSDHPWSQADPTFSDHP
mmetsp:Transcript_89448/g.255448  ORF Transcript_89448/g.255448 Transcript_89448/m.255448 type:complete len:320 (-) Transcript_89448:258-1217(-)